MMEVRPVEMTNEFCDTVLHPKTSTEPFEMPSMCESDPSWHYSRVLSISSHTYTMDCGMPVQILRRDDRMNPKVVDY